LHDANGIQSLQNAQTLHGGPQGLLRGAAAAVAHAGANHASSHPNDPAEQEICALTHFGQESGLMLDAGTVQSIIKNNFLGQGIEHIVGLLHEQRRVVKDYDTRLFNEEYLRDLRTHLGFVAQHAEIWNMGDHEILFRPCTDPLPDEPSAGIDHYLSTIGKATTVAALIYPDRRGSGYGLSRQNDDPRYDFTRIEKEPDVHFAHARVFVAKTSASEMGRVRELLGLARV
jgi:hypothetical protein